MRDRETFHPALSRREALRRTSELLAAQGVAATDARFLVLGTLGLEHVDLALYGERPVGPKAAANLTEAVRRRLAGEPVARILGAWEFWGLPFRLSPETLVPRPDTETVVEAALRSVPDRTAPLRILDLGTGSGCILVALLTELPRAQGLGLDRAVGALRIARANAVENGVAERTRFIASDWCACLAGDFDFVVSNPPYIASALIPGLEPDVRCHDPAVALDGGSDGLDAYRRIFADLAGLRLAAGAGVVLEIGFDQAESVSALGIAAGLALGGLARDLAGNPRVLTFTAAQQLPQM